MCYYNGKSAKFPILPVMKQTIQILNTPIHHHHFDTIDSTNTQLILDITNTLDFKQLHVYTASHQYRGRGQHGRTWEHGDDNVFLSFYTPIKNNQQTFGLTQLSGILSLVVGFYLYKLPIIEHINRQRHANNLSPIGVKWANDVGYFDKTHNQFYKLIGILIEPVFVKLGNKSTQVGVVIGVGLNVKTTPTIKDGLYQATSLHALGQTQLSAKDCYEPICHAIYQAILSANDFYQNPASFISFQHAFNQAHVLNNQCVNIYTQNNTQNPSDSGICLGINQHGALLLQNDQGTNAIFAGMASIALTHG